MDVGTFVVFIPFLQFFIEKKVPSKMNLLGVLFVFIGLIFLSSKGQNFLDIFSEIGSNFNVGDFLTLLCSILFALYMVYLDKISRENPFMPLVIFFSLGWMFCIKSMLKTLKASSLLAVVTESEFFDTYPSPEK